MGEMINKLTTFELNHRSNVRQCALCMLLVACTLLTLCLRCRFVLYVTRDLAR